jgi:hypothetical protein
MTAGRHRSSGFLGSSHRIWPRRPVRGNKDSLCPAQRIFVAAAGPNRKIRRGPPDAGADDVSAHQTDGHERQPALLVTGSWLTVKE